MKIVFLSNYFNHHQRPLAAAFARRAEGFVFVETEPMAKERLSMGWQRENAPYVLRLYEHPEPDRKWAALAEEGDVLIAGSAPERLVRAWMRTGKPVFRYSERPLKNGPERLKFLPRLAKWHYRNPAGKPVYLLCAGAYTAGDYARFGLFRNKAYRWGYFPEVKEHDGELLFRGKNTARILWCGRFLTWKHPEAAVRAASRLRDDGLDFRLDFIGAGPMEETLRRMILEAKLEDYVQLLGAMYPERVREEMEKSGIFLFTSDRREGWGAVLGEAMNSGCAVVADSGAGSTPYLIKHGENGLSYAPGDGDAAYRYVKELLTDPERQRALGTEACGTIGSCWNGEVAAERFVSLAERIIAGETEPVLYNEGPCSKDETGWL